MNGKISKTETDVWESQRGFSMVELIVSTVISLVILAACVGVFTSALGTRTRESSKTDAITSAQAALNVMSREIGNCGYGLMNNGLVADSTSSKLHCRTNVVNNNSTTSDPGEDIVYYLEGTNENRSVVRHDLNTGGTSGIINRISSVEFIYHVVSTDSGVAAGPSVNVVTITLTVDLDNAPGQPSGQTFPVRVSSNVTLRNSATMRGQY
jgi:prepilin-type N-terminal cleavage/methylation domain-containing protein